MRARPPVPERSSSRLRLAAPCVLALAASALWLSYPDKTFVFDGIVFAQVVDRSVDEWRREMLNPRHLLFNPFFQLLRDALARAGATVDAYRLFQEVNALAGAAGLLLFGDAARRLSRDAGLGWCAAELMRAKDWGFDLLREGFAPVMDAESMAKTRDRERRFGEYQKTAVFWLRAGNLYAILDLKPEAFDAWMRAQKLSGDQALLKRIEELKKPK